MKYILVAHLLFAGFITAQTFDVPQYDSLTIETLIPVAYSQLDSSLLELSHFIENWEAKIAKPPNKHENRDFYRYWKKNGWGPKPNQYSQFSSLSHAREELAVAEAFWRLAPDDVVAQRYLSIKLDWVLNYLY